MTILETLQQNYQKQLFTIKYNYATALLNNLSDATYSDLLDSHKEIFEPLLEGKFNTIDSVIEVLEKQILAKKDSDLMRQEIVSYIEGLTDDQIWKVEDFIEHHI